MTGWGQTTTSPSELLCQLRPAADMPLHEVMCKRLACLPNTAQQRTLLAATMQVRQQCPDPEQRDRNLSGQPLVTMGGGALPLPMPTQPATLTATRVATKATSTFFIGIPLSFTPRDAHFVPRCTVGRPRKPMVHRLRRQWGTSKGTVSLGTQLRGVRSKTCQKAAADRPPGTHHSPSISGLNSSSSALRLDRLLRLRWLTARCPTPSHLAVHRRTT